MDNNNNWLRWIHLYEFNIKLNYYKCFDPYEINHYNLINNLNKCISIYENYYKICLPEYYFTPLNIYTTKCQNTKFLREKQSLIIKKILNDINYICSENNKYNICSNEFKYIVNDVNLEYVKEYIKKDIIDNQ